MRHIKTLAVMVLSAVVMALQAVAQKPTPPPASPEEKLLSRAEIEAKLGQPIITSKQISDAMTEFYGFSLDEFCDLLKPAEGRLNVNFQPKDDKAADRLKQALFLAGNKSTGIEEEYEVFVRDTNSYEIVSVEPDSTGQKLGLKLGPITWKELDSTYQEALNRIGQQVGLKLGELIEDEPDGVRAGPRQKTFNWEVKPLSSHRFSVFGVMLEKRSWLAVC